MIVNFFGGPGDGKSLSSDGLGYQLGVRQIRSAKVPEYVKTLAWQATPLIEALGQSGIELDDLAVLKPAALQKIRRHFVSSHEFRDQNLIFAKQKELLDAVVGKVSVAIMECPLLMCLAYNRAHDAQNSSGHYDTSWADMVLKQEMVTYESKLPVVNILLRRTHPFQQGGRVHNEAQSAHVRRVLEETLRDVGRNPIVIDTHIDIDRELCGIVTDALAMVASERDGVIRGDITDWLAQNRAVKLRQLF